RGPFHIRMALTTAPTIPVASSRTLYAVPQQGVGSRAPCLGGGNRLFLDGSGWVYDGTQLITDGRFVMNYVGAFTLHFFLDPSDRRQGVGWEVWVSTERLAQPLLEQVYPYAERWPFESSNTAGMDVAGDGRGCDQLDGRFQIEELVRSGSTGVASATITF